MGAARASATALVVLALLVASCRDHRSTPIDASTVPFEDAGGSDAAGAFDATPSDAPPPDDAAPSDAGAPDADASAPACPINEVEAGAQGADAPDEPSLAAADLTRTWATLALPHGGHSAQTFVLRDPAGFTAYAYDVLFTTAPHAQPPAQVWEYVYQSTDGVTWQPKARPPYATYLSAHSIVYGAGRYLVASDSGLATSTDLTSWSPVGAYDAGCASVPQDGLFRRHGRFFGFGSDGLVFVSNDGLAWDQVAIPKSQGSGGFAYGNGTFVMTSTDLPDGIRPDLGAGYSLDGVKWTWPSEPSCETPGAICNNRGTGEANSERSSNVFFGNGRFYLEIDASFSSADGVTWASRTGPIVHDVVGGYLFHFQDPVEARGIEAWQEGDTPQSISVLPPVASTPIASDLDPVTISTPLPGGQTCLTNRCIIVGGVLYLIE